MGLPRKCCFRCANFEGKYHGTIFFTMCNKKRKQTFAEKVCDDFTRNPPYTIKSKAVRQAFRGLPPSTLTPKSEEQEKIVADFIDRIGKIANEYAREVAREAVNRIGRKD